MSITICNMCKKEFDKVDYNQDFSFHHKVGYGSIYDGDEINLDLCCDCIDKVIKYIIDECEINPIKNN